MKKIILATGNPGKVRELNAMLNGHYAVVSQKEMQVEEVPETGSSFIENALIKARNAASQTGLPALADDSGLEVDALSGDPGVKSARYGGNACASDQDRVNLLLKNMENIQWEERTARFRCVIAVADSKGIGITQAEGSIAGMIQYRPKGDAGFGYDSIFYSSFYDKTLAEMSMEEKNQLSHRGNAVKIVVKTLKNLTPDSL